MGCPLGFKLHLIINNKDEIFNFMFTLGSLDDRDPLKLGKVLEEHKGKSCADNGYIYKPNSRTSSLTQFSW